MRLLWPLLLAVSLALAGCNKTAPASDTAAKKDEDNSPGVHLKDEEIKGLGLKTSPAESARYLPGINGYGVVATLDAIGQADADLMTTQAAATQSLAAAARARSLSTGEEAAI